MIFYILMTLSVLACSIVGIVTEIKRLKELRRMVVKRDLFYEEIIRCLNESEE